MTYRGGIGGNRVAAPRSPQRRRVTLDRVLAATALVVSLANIAWEVAR